MFWDVSADVIPILRGGRRCSFGSSALPATPFQVNVRASVCISDETLSPTAKQFGYDQADLIAILISNRRTSGDLATLCQPNAGVR